MHRPSSLTTQARHFVGQLRKHPRSPVLLTQLFVMFLPLILVAAFALLVRGQQCSGNDPSCRQRAGGPAQIYHERWGYHEDAGPSFWPTRWNFPKCAGQRQSPINIVENYTVYSDKLTPIHFDGYDQQPSEARLINTGNTLALRIKAKNQIDIIGGLLDGEYIFDHLHFHWGSSDFLGSEHFIDNKPTPMEVHFVHYNSKYPGVLEALNDEQGLAVLGFLFELSDQDNRALDMLLTGLNFTLYKDQSTTILPFPLSAFLPRPGHMREYFRYQGSLTTPPCSEAVQWTVFEEEIPVSRRQLEQLRRVFDDDDDGTDHEHEMMSDNFRPPQPLNGRVVSRSFPHLTALY